MGGEGPATLPVPHRRSEPGEHPLQAGEGSGGGQFSRLCATGPSDPSAAARLPPPPLLLLLTPSPYSFKSLPSTLPIGSHLLPGHGVSFVLQ